MNLIDWLAKKTCYTFTIALLSVLGGQIASLYGYFYFYGYFTIQHDTAILNILPNNIWYGLVFLLIFVSAVHYAGFGLLRIFRRPLEFKRLRIINDHIMGSTIDNNLSFAELTNLLEALTRFPLWNTCTAGILGFLLFISLQTIVIAHTGSMEYIGLGLRSGLIAWFIYLYITYEISDYLTSPVRALTKKAIFQLGKSFKESYQFSLKKKYALFFVLILITLAVMNSFGLTPENSPEANNVLSLFNLLTVLICSFLALLYITSILQSIKEARAASEDLASGGAGYIFSGSLDKEFVLLNRSIIATADEVNQYRTKMEALVKQKTKALEISLEEIHEREKRFRSMVENGSDIITILNTDGSIRYESPSVERVLGYKPEELIGKCCFDLVHSEDLQAVKDRYAQGIKIPRFVIAIEYRCRHKDGSWRTLKTVGKNFLNDPAIAGIIVNSRDITEGKKAEEEVKKYHQHLEDLVEERTSELKKEISERKQIEQKIRMLNEELENRVKERTTELEKACEDLKELDEMKDSFLSLVSHELRTPLTSIRSFSEILLQYNHEEPETQKEFLHIINSESERLTRLIEDVLDLSRIEAGRMMWHDDLISIEDVVKDVVRAQHQLLQNKSIDLSIDIPSGLPLIFVDRDRIQQMFMNLLGNAVKFSYERTKIQIRLETFKAKRYKDSSAWMKISISDQGTGIEEDYLEIIFDRFQQGSADTLKDRPKGTGLGLPICKEIVSHYGGDIWAESEQGKGSTFHILLPLTTDDIKTDRETLKIPEEKTNKEKKTILVVNGDPTTSKILHDQLERKNLIIIEASTTAQIIDLSQKRQIDMILLDLMMSVQNGQNALEIIRQNPSTENIPVLIISVIESSEEGVVPGAYDYISKPFKEKELINKIQGLLGEKKRTVLVVDDNPAVRETLRIQLESQGYPVYLAHDGQEAIEFLETRVPDLVILDVIMPKKNGPEVLNWIRNNPGTKNLPVMILTGYSLSGEKTKMLSLGVNAYVNKSKGQSLLFERINSVLLSLDTLSEN